MPTHQLFELEESLTIFERSLAAHRLSRERMLSQLAGASDEARAALESRLRINGQTVQAMESAVLAVGQQIVQLRNTSEPLNRSPKDLEPAT